MLMPTTSRQVRDATRKPTDTGEKTNQTLGWTRRWRCLLQVRGVEAWQINVELTQGPVCRACLLPWSLIGSLQVSDGASAQSGMRRSGAAACWTLHASRPGEPGNLAISILPLSPWPVPGSLPPLSTASCLCRLLSVLTLRSRVREATPSPCSSSVRRQAVTRRKESAL